MPRPLSRHQRDIVKRDPDSSLMDDNGDDDRTVMTSSPPLFQGRSDAPTPSEQRTESDPLLREVRAVRTQPSVAVGSPGNQDESFFRTSFQDIGKKLKDCNDTLGELQQLGVSHEVQLPELVLVGDQSAGKSSLMSGLANLDLPRSEGTCTRCPLHIRVSRNSDWSCRVSLRRDYIYVPPTDRPIRESDVTDQDPFFPWKKRPATVVHEFKTMHDSDQIEEVLRWGQIAILNDAKHHASFVPKSGSVALSTPLEKAAEETAAKFSPNVVALEIKGPGLPDLSFYDMPGIFENPADARDDYLVNVVRNLTRSYMSHPSAIIICCMPMNSDAENSSSFGLTRRLGATSRTIGVLTKADLLPEGNHDQWLGIMRGEAHHTGLGYFITSRPQGKDLEDLTKWEHSVFVEQSFDQWPKSFHPFSARCGIEKLKSFLSEKLGEEFVKSLPTIKRKVKSLLDKTTKQLDSLPELPDNVELEIQTGLNAFADNSRKNLDSFMRHFNVLPGRFRDCLLAIKPKFTLKDKSDIPVLEISDDESDAPTPTPTPSHATPSSKRHASSYNVTPSKRPRMAAAVSNGTMSNGNYIKPEEGVPASPAAHKRSVLPEPFTEFTEIGRGFRTLRQVREEMRAKTKAGMPDHISEEVYFDLVREAVEPWNRPTDAFIKQTMKDVQAEMDDALKKSLASFKKRFVYPETRKHVHKFLEEHRKETERALTQLYDDERERLLTFNEKAFERYRDDEQFILDGFRLQMRMEAACLPTQPAPRGEMTAETRAQELKRRQAEAARLGGQDQFVRELEVVAYIRGYYRLAALRFADAASQRILCRMIPAIRRELQPYLDERLGLRGPDAKLTYQRLMEEDEATATKREGLKSERTKFERALESIELLETGASRGAGGGGRGGAAVDADVDVAMDEV